MTEQRDAQDYQQKNIVTMPLFLAIDQGGHASRVIVFDQFGNKVVEARRTVEVSHPQPDWVEQDADALAQSVQFALDEALDKLGARRQFVVAAGLVTQRSNIVCWDRDTGRTLSAAISWQDRRAHRWMQSFGQHADTIRRITGLVPSAHYGVSKIHWCLQHLKDVAAARKQGTLACGPLASFLLFRLLKEQPFVVDSVNASRTLLWDQVSLDWSSALLSLFSLETDYLPQCVPNHQTFGHLNVGGQPIPLTVCSGDQAAALFSSGIPKPWGAYLNMGTGAFMQCLLPSMQNQSSPEDLLQSIVWDEAGKTIQVLEATVNGAGSALSVVEKELGLPVGKAISSYVHWLENAENIPLYINGISGLGSPFWRPDFVSEFVGDNTEISTPGEKVVAVMESILFLLKVNLEELQSESVDVQRIIISGGLSVLDDLCQRLADLSGLVVVRPAQSEATAKGLAFLLAKTFEKSPTGKMKTVWDDEQAVENKADEFSPFENSALLGRYQKWRLVLDQKLSEGSCT